MIKKSVAGCFHQTIQKHHDVYRWKHLTSHGRLSIQKWSTLLREVQRIWRKLQDPMLLTLLLVQEKTVRIAAEREKRCHHFSHYGRIRSWSTGDFISTFSAEWWHRFLNTPPNSKLLVENLEIRKSFRVILLLVGGSNETGFVRWKHLTSLER